MKARSALRPAGAPSPDSDRRIAHYMTPRPHTIGRQQRLVTAHEIMRQRQIRHLPVLDDGALVGLVSLGDLRLVETLPGVDAESTSVEDAMTTELFTVGPDARLDEVVDAMAKHKYGSTLVIDRGQLVGIFTTTDALHALGGILGELRTRAPRAAGGRP